MDGFFFIIFLACFIVCALVWSGTIKSNTGGMVASVIFGILSFILGGITWISIADKARANSIY